MKKNKILIACIAGIAVVIIGIIVAMFATGKFSSLKEAFKSEPVTVTQQETTQAEIPVAGRPKSPAPESVVAAVYSEFSENTAADLAEFEAMGLNTVIFELTKENGDAVSAALEAAQTAKLYFGIKADISQGGEFLSEFSKNFNTDFVIIGGADETLPDYAEKALGICKTIKENDPSMVMGLEPVYTSKASDSITDAVADGVADFVFLNHESGKNSVFQTAQTVWNEEACPLWLCHNLKGLSSFKTEEASSMVELIAASADMSMCRGLAFAPFGDMKTAKGTSADIVMNYVRKRDTYLLDKEFSLTSHKKTNITVEQSTITFSGTSSPAHPLKCNGYDIKVAKNGDFSVDVSLEAGKNTVKFEHKGKTYTYNVTYKIKLLKSVSPADSITVPGGMQIEVTAVALKSALVTVDFNGQSYKMTAMGSVDGEDESAPDEASDFTTFSAILNTPEGTESVQKLGKYKVTAKYKSLTENLSGASINIAAVEPPPPPPPTTQPPETSTQAPDPSSPSDETGSTDVSGEAPSSETQSAVPPSGTVQKYYYTNDYGLGTAKICEIIDDYVETYPGANNTRTISVPDCSPLLKGTVDYVTAEVPIDNETYYFLASGVKVPKLREEKLTGGVDGKVNHVSIKSGYIMPKNTINVLSCSSASGDTVIVLEMNRPVAFNAKLTGQTYSLYNKDPGRPVVVSSLNCSALEFTFSDTAAAHGDLSLMNSVCKGGRFSADTSSSKVTLTLDLAERGRFYGFHYEYDGNGNLVITVKHKPAALSGYTIMLDPGHGGIDGGAPCAVSKLTNGTEKDINLSIATKVKELLEAEGAKVVMTRSTDKYVSYTERNTAVRNHNPDMFISIHCDSSSSSAAKGTSAYYYRAYGQPLAKAIHESLCDAYKNRIYKNNPDMLKDHSRGANFYAFRVARVEECPAILIEYGFVSNITECEMLQTPENRNILAEATVQGIKNYISAS